MARLRDKTTGILNFSEYKKGGFKLVYALMIFLLFVGVLTALAPPVWLFVSSFKDASELTKTPYSFWPGSFDLSKLAEVWKILDFGKYFLNTLAVVAGAAVSAVVFNGLFAYAFAVIKPKGYKIFYGLVLAGYMIPAVTSIVPLYKAIVALKLVNTFVPLWLAFGANAFYLVIFKNYFESLPKAVFEAAEVDGASKIRSFFSIAVPLSRPVVGIIAVFATTAAWSDFLLPYLVLTDDDLMTVMVQIYRLQTTMGTRAGFGPDKLLMALTISIIPQIILFAIFQRQITGTAANSGIKE
jgi:ABC-type sugar transport system, permease component